MSDYLSSFNGNVQQQCLNGTFPRHRDILIRHLNRSVEKGHMTREEADERMKNSDTLWKKHAKDHK